MTNSIITYPSLQKLLKSKFDTLITSNPENITLVAAVAELKQSGFRIENG